MPARQIALDFNLMQPGRAKDRKNRVTLEKLSQASPNSALKLFRHLIGDIWLFLFVRQEATKRILS